MSILCYSSTNSMNMQIVPTVSHDNFSQETNQTFDSRLYNLRYCIFRYFSVSREIQRRLLSAATYGINQSFAEFSDFFDDYMQCSNFRQEIYFGAPFSAFPSYHRVPGVVVKSATATVQGRYPTSTKDLQYMFDQCFATHSFLGIEMRAHQAWKMPARI